MFVGEGNEFIQGTCKIVLHALEAVVTGDVSPGGTNGLGGAGDPDQGDNRGWVERGNELPVLDPDRFPGTGGSQVERGIVEGL